MLQIRVGSHVVTSRVTQATTCPAGTAYWVVDYAIREVTIYTAHTGPIFGSPSPIALLDQTIERWLPCADPNTPGYFTLADGQGQVRITKTHRDWLIDALASVVGD